MACDAFTSLDTEENHVCGSEFEHIKDVGVKTVLMLKCYATLKCSLINGIMFRAPVNGLGCTVWYDKIMW